MLATLRARSASAAVAIAGVVGPDEILLAAGLTLVTVALWPVVGRVALLVPGLVILWIAIPQRAGFIAPPPDATAGKGRKGA